jgi:hypothetical protein
MAVLLTELSIRIVRLLLYAACTNKLQPSAVLWVTHVPAAVQQLKYPDCTTVHNSPDVMLKIQQVSSNWAST